MSCYLVRKAGGWVCIFQRIKTVATIKERQTRRTAQMSNKLFLPGFFFLFILFPINFYFPE